MASTQVVELSVANNSPSQDSSCPDDFFQSRHVTPGFMHPGFSFLFSANSLDGNLMTVSFLFSANTVGRDFSPPKRPNFGSVGRQIALRTNFFRVKLPKGDIHHYDLSISPDKCPRRVNRDIVEAMVSTYHKVFGEQRPVFDGRKNLYSSRALPIGRKPVSLVSLDLSFIFLNGIFGLHFVVVYKQGTKLCLSV